MKRGLRQISILLLAVITVFLAGCAVNGPEGLPAPAGSDAAIAGRGFATGTYDREYQLYNMFYADGSVISYLVENGNWNYLGQLNVGAEVGRGTSTLAVLSRREGNTPGSRLRLNSDCSEYNLEFDDTGNYWITSSAGAVDRFAVPLNTGQPIRQIAGTNDAITIHTTSSGVAWFTLHCDLSGGQPAPPAAVCGNNIVETGEVCDGSSLAGQSCNTRGFTGGTLSCAANCLSFNTNLCTTTLCGNNVVETGEVCDGSSLAGQSCSTRGFTGGTISCSVDCRSFNTNLCTTTLCGNNVVETGEVCDDGNTASSDGCSNSCVIESGFTCTGTPSSCVRTPSPSVCGNGIREGSEACDDGNTVTETSCPDGTASCSRCRNDCQQVLNLVGPRCGDRIINGAEACDDGNTASSDGCSNSCAIESGFTCTGTPSSCVRTPSPSVCGNGIREGSEACDDGNTVTETSCSDGTASCSRCRNDCQQVLNLVGSDVGTYDREYQLYNMFYADGSVISYLVENGNWNYLGQLNVGAEVGRGTSTLAVLSRREGNTPGSRLRLNSDCSEYNLEFDDKGNYWITSSAGAVDRFAVPLNTGQPIRQIAGTNDAITIHTTSSGVAWFTLHCDLSGGQPDLSAAVCGNNIVETG